MRNLHACDFVDVYNLVIDNEYVKKINFQSVKIICLKIIVFTIHLENIYKTYQMSLIIMFTSICYIISFLIHKIVRRNLF